MTGKYSIDFVNEGEPFDIKNWTPRKHEAALDKLLKEGKDLTDEERSNEFKYYCIRETLLEVDPEVQMEDIRDMHSLDLVDLFNDVYNKGRKGIYFQKGDKKKRPKSKKSTGKKN